MSTRLIQLCYRKIMDRHSVHPWEKYVLEGSWQEWRMQSQRYNTGNKYQSFAELLLHVPAAEELHFLVSAAVTGYVQQLNGVVPDVLDNLGRHCLRFQQYRFEIVNSSLEDRLQHQVAINFFSDTLYWHETVGSNLVVSPADTAVTGGTIPVYTVPLVPFLSISSINYTKNGIAGENIPGR